MSSRVLVVEAGEGQARSTLATVRALAATGYHPVVAIPGEHSIVAASRRCAGVVRVPSVEHDGFRTAVESELASGDYLTTMVTSDAALLALGVPVKHLIDKALLARAAEEAGLQTPPSEIFASGDDLLHAASAGFSYPIVIKTVLSGAPVQRIDDASELAEASLQTGPLLVQPFLHAPLRSIAGVVWRDRLVAVVHQRYLRTWPRRCGGACAAITLDGERVSEERIVKLLRGFEGIFHAQFCGDYLLDLNPRPYGSLPLATRAGLNLPAILCELLRGGDAPGTPLRAAPGYMYRWIEGEVRHVAGALAAREMTPREAVTVLRPRRNVSHGPDSIADPAPTLARLGYAFRSGKWRARTQNDGDHSSAGGRGG